MEGRRKEGREKAEFENTNNFISTGMMRTNKILFTKYPLC